MRATRMRWGCLAVLSAAAISCAWGAYRLWEQHSWGSPLPPLLSNVRATRGGVWGACPSDNRRRLESPIKGEPLSPELDERLWRQFPPGTPEARLISALAEQRFEQPIPCKDDETIRSANFFQQGTRAEVFWKVDQANNIVWTKGFIFYRWF